MNAIPKELTKVLSLEKPGLRDENYKFTSLQSLELPTGLPAIEQAYRAESFGSPSSSLGLKSFQEFSDSEREAVFHSHGQIDDFFGNYAESCAQNWSGLVVPKNSRETQNLRSSFVPGQNPQVLRRSLRVGAESQLSWLEDLCRDGGESETLVILTQVYLERGAVLRWTQAQVGHSQLRLYHRIFVELEEGATCQFRGFYSKAQQCQNRFLTRSLGAGSEFSGRAFVKTEGKDHFDFWVDNEIDATNSRSNFRIDSSSNDQSKVIFNGMIRISQNGAKSESVQRAKSLLLSERASIESLPKLEIAIDDVKVSHGASVSNLNENQLFYLRSRGFSESEATQMILTAMLEPSLELLGSEDEKKWAREKLGVSSECFDPEI